jgi:hypothetical protein
LEEETGTFANRAGCLFINIESEAARSGETGYRNQACLRPFKFVVKSRKGRLLDDSGSRFKYHRSRH